ncbi:MAG TPA: dioxygenase [Candidatus Dormibacteraeota bacterium]
MTAATTPPRLTTDPETTERLRHCVLRAVAAVHELARELRLTETELHALVGFLTEVGRADEFMLLSDITHTSILVDALGQPADADGATSSNVEGPLYRPGSPLVDTPAVLDHAGQGDDALLLRGRVVEAASGTPLGGAIVEIWQANQQGLYENQDAAQPDGNLRGRVRCDAQGGYEVRTVVPGPYRIATTAGPVLALLTSLGRHDNRPAHIHVKASAEGHEALTTMLFIAGDPWLGDDVIGAVKPELVVTPRPTELPGVAAPRRAFAVEFEIALRPAPATSKSPSGARP